MIGVAPPLRVRADDPGYAADAAAEAEFWSRPHAFGIGLPNAAFADGPFDRYTNRRFTGDENVRWFETIGRYGRFERGLVLGAASLDIEARLLELQPALSITLCDISAGAVESHARELERRFPGRVRAEVVDLNFAELPVAAYDVCVSSATLHHITNLEHLAWQVNRSLAPGGYVFVQDYVGEARFHFGARKRRVFECVLERDVRERPERRDWTMDWPEQSETQYSPFEAVRSDETLGVLRTYLDAADVRVAGAVGGLFLFRRRGELARAGALARMMQRAGERQRARMLRRFQQDVMLLDAILCDSGVLLPNNAFAVLRKKA
jgi:SAM-dependent methyltransferase